MKVNLIARTPNPEKIVAAAAKLCYSNVEDIDTLMDGLTYDNVGSFVERLASMGHSSPLEHAVFTFAIEGVSRALLAQITRHRLASFSVQSQRYCSMEDTMFVYPELLGEVGNTFFQSYENSLNSYNKLIELGVPKEDARFVLPESTHTRMILTMNARELIHFFSLRCCNRAQWEIRELATKMYELVYAEAPRIFASAGPGCVDGRCPEGSMCCGKSAEMKEKFAMIRK